MPELYVDGAWTRAAARGRREIRCPADGSLVAEVDEAGAEDTEAAIAVLAGGLAGNRILERKAANMLAGNFEPGFRIDLHHKDMGIVTAAARERDVVIPLGALTAQLVAAVRAQGDGDLDHSALLRGVERLSGLMR